MKNRVIQHLFFSKCRQCYAHKEYMCSRCTECDVCAQHVCGGNPKHVISCNSKKLSHFINDVAGPFLTSPLTQAPLLPDLPPFVPQLTTGLGDLTFAASELDIVAVSGEKVMLADGTLSVENKEKLLKKFGLPDRSVVILNCSVQEKKLEKLWKNQYLHSIIDRVAAVGFDAVLAPNFSIMSGHSRWQHLINIKKTNLVYNSLVELGVPTVPYVSFYDCEDARRIAKWLSDIPNLKYIYVCTQLMKGKKGFRNELLALKGFLEMLDHNPSIIFSGPSNLRRIGEAKNTFPASVYITTQPMLSAISGRIYTYKGNALRRNVDRVSPKQVVFLQNIRAFRSAINDIQTFALVEKEDTSVAATHI